MGTCNFLFHFPAIMFTCTTCMLQFDLRTVYNTHIRKCIPISNFATHTGQHVTATRNKEGVFLCYCSHPDYPKPTGYFTTNNLRKHMKKVQSTWIGPNNNKQSAQLKVKLCMIPISVTLGPGRDKRRLLRRWMTRFLRRASSEDKGMRELWRASSKDQGAGGFRSES